MHSAIQNLGFSLPCNFGAGAEIKFLEASVSDANGFNIGFGTINSINVSLTDAAMHCSYAFAGVADPKILAPAR